MTYQQLLAHFGGLSKVAEALGVDRRRVWNWSERRIPSKWQAKIESVSDGKLRADKKARADAALFVSFMDRRAAA